jgi:putative glutamine amidotransferase
MPAPKCQPIVGVTCDLTRDPALRARVRTAYAERLTTAGALAIFLPPIPEQAEDHAHLCDALLTTGGDDPITEPFGAPTHPQATRVDPARQAYELAILRAFDVTPHKPVLGVCLGMQYMALARGGALDQHLPDTTPTSADHAGDHIHAIIPEPGDALPAGAVASNHHQAVSDPGALAIAARAHDGVIEAIRDPARPFFLGVQWHPERTDDPGLGQALFDQLVRAARSER